MNQEEEKAYKEYIFILDIIHENISKSAILQETIKALETNQSYRAMFEKNYLEKKIAEKRKTDVIVEALSFYRDSLK